MSDRTFALHKGSSDAFLCVRRGCKVACASRVNGDRILFQFPGINHDRNEYALTGLKPK